MTSFASGMSHTGSKRQGQKCRCNWKVLPKQHTYQTMTSLASTFLKTIHIIKKFWNGTKKIILIHSKGGNKISSVIHNTGRKKLM